MNSTEHYYESERLLRLAQERFDKVEQVAPGDDQRIDDLNTEIAHLNSMATAHALLAAVPPLTVIDRDVPKTPLPKWLDAALPKRSATDPDADKVAGQ